ncbi:hypothetical protein JCM15831A_12260 [Asaia astilbis]
MLAQSSSALVAAQRWKQTASFDFRDGAHSENFSSYDEAEKAALNYCRNRNALVTLNCLGTHLATLYPQHGSRPRIEMTWTGSAYA